MTRRELLSAAVAVALLAGGAALLPATRGASGTTAPHFPQLLLPQAPELQDPPGTPIGALGIIPSKVLGMYLNRDSAPDILALTDAGEVRGLLNVAGRSEDASLFVKAPLSLELGGRAIDVLVTDLDADGAHDVAFLVQHPPELARVPATGTVVSVRGATIEVSARFLPRELVGQSVTLGTTPPTVLTVTDNTATSITVDTSATRIPGSVRPGTTIATARFEMSELRPALVVAYRTGDGVLTAGDCTPPLPSVAGKEPVGLGAADADGDGTVDLIVRLAPVTTGSVGAVEKLSEDVEPAFDRALARHGRWVFRMTDARATFTDGAVGARIVADTREGRSYPVTDATPTSLTFLVEGSAPTAAQAGSPYRLILPADEGVVLRGLGSRCFAPATPVARPVYAVGVRDVDGELATVLTDPDARLRPAGAYLGADVRVGPTPLPPDARTVRIVRHTQSELTLDPAAGDLLGELSGIVDGGAPSSYAIVPRSVSAPDPSAFLQNERSSITLAPDRVPFASPGRSAPASAAIIDADGDGSADLVVASSQLLLLLHE